MKAQTKASWTIAGTLPVDRKVCKSKTASSPPTDPSTSPPPPSVHIHTGRGHLLQKKYFGKEENTTASQQMLQQVACFLHRELPIRLAHRVRDLDAMYVCMCDTCMLY